MTMEVKKNRIVYLKQLQKGQFILLEFYNHFIGCYQIKQNVFK